jgi:hypothetical protein
MTEGRTDDKYALFLPSDPHWGFDVRPLTAALVPYRFIGLALAVVASIAIGMCQTIQYKIICLAPSRLRADAHGGRLKLCCRQKGTHRIAYSS